MLIQYQYNISEFMIHWIWLIFPCKYKHRYTQYIYNYIYINIHAYNKHLKPWQPSLGIKAIHVHSPKGMTIATIWNLDLELLFFPAFLFGRTEPSCWLCGFYKERHGWGSNSKVSKVQKPIVPHHASHPHSTSWSVPHEHLRCDHGHSSQRHRWALDDLKTPNGRFWQPTSVTFLRHDF